MDVVTLLNKHKNKVVNIIIIIVALVITSKIYEQQIKQAQKLKQEINAEIIINAELAKISGLEGKINAYKKLLVNNDPNAAINVISAIAKELGIKIQGIKPLDAQNNPDYTKFLFQLSINVSSYHALGKFISNVENSADVYIVESLKITPNEVNPTKELSVNLIISSLAAN